MFPLIKHEFQKLFMHTVLLEFVILWCKLTYIFSCELKKNLCLFMSYCTNSISKEPGLKLFLSGYFDAKICALERSGNNMLPTASCGLSCRQNE